MHFFFFFFNWNANCRFSFHVPPCPPPKGSSSGLRSQDERTAARACKCTACLLSSLVLHLLHRNTSTIEKHTDKPRGNVCATCLFKLGGQSWHFFFFFLLALPSVGAQLPLAVMTPSAFAQITLSSSPLSELVLHSVPWRRISDARCIQFWNPSTFHLWAHLPP